MANLLFDPTEFFGKTAAYPSQGRGVFQTDLPSKLVDKKDDRITKAKELLRGGIMAKSVMSPSASLATFEPFSFSGPTRKAAHTQIFGPLGIEFYLMGQDADEAESLYYTFMQWLEMIAGPTTRDEIPESDITSFAIEYYKNYIVGQADFKIYSPTSTVEASTKKGDPIIWNQYYEIYPQTVGQLNTSWDNQDTPITLNVEFEFYYMTTNKDRKFIPKGNS